ncbi:uncharacterized protein LOC101847514 [Aplysia californica]|uniref:Uncharacterized protein LOC101847514 n=1 Tax=Aplysia californica TaxID=6500 RepID=A0ABM0JYL5_APLCA|nr:uncharacterized protein LOC101847514 [Aplysia californica]XP_005104598.1 uncharacterized protein LOC101847514 [Aplysia californica]XP_005104599.1 uncharacterized protein LOC101847514 [Aplysia californica]
MNSTVKVCMFLVVFCWGVYLVSPTPYTWMERDSWDIINERFSNVTAQNCRSKHKEELMLPVDSVAAVPKYNQLLSSKTYSNRTNLLHVHNLALNRAFFYSLIYQRMNHSWDFNTQPGLMYIYMSATADVTASPGFINGSGIFFDTDCAYPNWYVTLDFNKTIALFGPKAWRADDYNEPTNFLREPTNGTIDIWDLAAGNAKNYTDRRYKSNPWVDFWLPDWDSKTDSQRKFTYSVGIKYSNVTGMFKTDAFEEFKFFGPQQPGSGDPDIMLPVIVTRPYFDCGRSNRWIVTASSPVVDFMPRYSNYTQVRRPRFVAVSTMDIEFERLDMNQCPIMQGNPGPNAFAGTARCRPTTACEPLMGFGFRRGGYQCVCLPGYYYPWWHDGPFLGMEMEQATREEWEVGFDCLTVQDRVVIPTQMPSFVRRRRSVASSKDRFLSEISSLTQSPRLTTRMKRSLIPRIKAIRDEVKRQKRDEEAASPKVTIKKRYAAKHKVPASTAHKRRKREAVDEQSVNRMLKILERFQKTTAENCEEKKAYELFLPGDAAYGVKWQFEGQGRTALRLAHFLSNFLQNVDEYEEFGNLRGDRRLNETQIFSEVLANVMADWKIVGAGVFFDRYKFRMSPPVNNTDPRFVNGITREFFGPYAWRIKATGVGSVGGADYFRAMDFAGLKHYYTDEPWFRSMKARWGTNFVNLKKFTAKPLIRSDLNGTSLVRFEYYPYTYKAAQYEDGEWLRPQFRCDSRLDSWVVTYQAPFFGLDDIKERIEFKGVVTVDVDLNEMGINQCPGDFPTANAFKNTARCDYETQFCTPVESKGFRTGYYKCECRQGFEYTFNDLNWYFDGQQMEKEYKMKMQNEPNRFDSLKCRIAGASAASSSAVLITLLLALSTLWR